MADRIFVKTPVFRGSFVNLVTARANKGDDGEEGDPKFGLMIVLDRGDSKTKMFINELNAAIIAACKDKFGKAPTRKNKLGKTVPNADLLKHFPIRKGEGVGDGEQFAGMWCIRASTRFKPPFIDKTGEKLESEDELYSGAHYRVKVSVWAWDSKKGGKGVSVSLETGVKVKDDDKFGGGGNAAEDFADDIGGSDDAGTDDLE